MGAIESTFLDDALEQELSGRLADVFRTADISDVPTEDVFLDGHLPLWRFQLQGRDAFVAWLMGYTPNGAETTVARTIPTTTGFVTELRPSRGQRREDHRPQDRAVRRARRPDRRTDGLLQRRLEPELHVHHAAEAPIIRP